MDAGKRTMMQRMSGRVSGLLDDLSDAISLLNDIMPSKASEQVPRSPSGTAQSPIAPPDMAWGLRPVCCLMCGFTRT